MAPEAIRILSQVSHPDVVVVLDDSLLEVARVTDGMAPGGIIIVNTTRTAAELGLRDDVRVVTADVSGSAEEAGVIVGGKPMVNTAILGSIAAATQLVTLASIESALSDAFSPAAAEKNIRAVRLAHDRTKA